MTKDREVLSTALSSGLSGFLDVKAPAKGRRKPFGPWKAWRRYWVTASQCSVSGGVELALSSTPIGRVTRIVCLPTAATLCRTKSRSKQFAFVAVPPANSDEAETPPPPSPSTCTLETGSLNSACVFLAGRSESESQRWMEALRAMLLRATNSKFDGPSFVVTFSDTTFARRAGLAGVTGSLTMRSGVGLMIHDVATESLIASWSWSMIMDSHLAGDSMVILVTTKDFALGSGQFQLHCSKAPVLARALSSSGRPVPRMNLALQRGRRLSRSEGDLFIEFQQEQRQPDLRPPLPSRVYPKHSFSPLRLLATRRRAETMVHQSTRSLNVAGSPPTTLSILGGKIASSLLSAGLGLILSTPGGSEAEDDDDSDICDVDYSDADAEEDSDTSRLGCPDDSVCERRASTISAASGIYEEIYENAAAAAAAARRLEPQLEDPYVDPALLFSPISWPGNLASPRDPPPLPPRHNLRALDGYRRLSSSDSSSSFDALSSEGHYVPMSPSRHSAPPSCPAEPHYLPMAALRIHRIVEDQEKVADTSHSPMTECPTDR